MRYRVYHNRNLFGPNRDLPPEWEQVAHVEARDLETVFYLTNTLDRPWWENRGVTPTFEGKGARSTSVGDQIVDADGRTWEVASLGFTELVS